jgi:hypothetical protein
MANEQEENDSDYLSESLTMSDSFTSISNATTNTTQNDSLIRDLIVSPSRTNSCVSLQEWDGWCACCHECRPIKDLQLQQCC